MSGRSSQLLKGSIANTVFERMTVGLLQTMEYPADGPWRSSRMADPDWVHVESAIGQMDGERFPHIELFVGGDPNCNDLPEFELLGGRIGYVVTARIAGQEFHYRDSSGAQEEVAVWTSDQGFSCP